MRPGFTRFHKRGWGIGSLSLIGSSLSLSSASSAEKSPDWSDEESGANPFAANGEGNPFEDETPASPEISVAVRALYDYEGQEQDELSFKAGGDMLTIKGILTLHSERLTPLFLVKEKTFGMHGIGF